MKNAICVLAMIMLAAPVRGAASAGEPLDATKVRQLHQKVKNGQPLTTEEQAYYERGKAARQTGELTKKKEVSGTPPATGSKTSTGLVPLPDMSASDRYKDQDGGLYGGGNNTAPEAHLKAAMELAGKIQPLDADGRPSPGGRIVLLTHGMSNTTMESQGFLKLANAESAQEPGGAADRRRAGRHRLPQVGARTPTPGATPARGTRWTNGSRTQGPHRSRCR